MAENKNNGIADMATAKERLRYYFWRCIRVFSDDPTMKELSAFYEWSLANGYVDGALLLRHDPGKPYSRENCYWSNPAENAKPVLNVYWVKPFIRKWDETVNRIRKASGMEPIYSSEEYYEQ